MPNKLSYFWQELKRRKVTRVITVYAAASFVILELVSIIIEPLKLPEWTLPMIIVLICVGFIITIIVSWIYDIHPEGGIVKTDPTHKVKEEDIPKSSNSWKIASYISFAVIVALIVFNIIPRIKTSRAIADLEKSIAVLPFDNLSGNEDQAYFCDGITDVVINQLSKIKEFRVIGRTSTLRYKENIKTLSEIGEEMQVNFIIEGTVQRQEDQIRIIVQLIQVQNEDHLWSKLYDREWKDVFIIQSEIAKQIAVELETILSTEEIKQIEKSPTDNLEAFNLYLRGLFFLDKRTDEGINSALKYFRDATEMDNNYALAYAGIANCYVMASDYGYILPEDGCLKGKEAIMKALDIDNTLSDTHVSLGHLIKECEWDWEGAINSFKRAIQLNPNNGFAFVQYANLLRVLGQFDEAISKARQGLALDPLSPISNASVIHALYAARKYDQVIEEASRAIIMNLEYFPLLMRAGLAYSHKGMFSKAIEKMKLAVQLSGEHYSMKAHLGYINGVAGNHAEAQRMLEALLKTSKIEYISPLYFAIVYIGLGDNQQAIDWLEKALEMKEHRLLYLYTDPIYDPLRTDPRFIEIINKIGFE